MTYHDIAQACWEAQHSQNMHILRTHIRGTYDYVMCAVCVQQYGLEEIAVPWATAPTEETGA